MTARVHRLRTISLNIIIAGVQSSFSQVWYAESVESEVFDRLFNDQAFFISTRSEFGIFPFILVVLGKNHIQQSLLLI